jgi:hypothetical protein
MGRTPLKMVPPDRKAQNLWWFEDMQVHVHDIQGCQKNLTKQNEGLEAQDRPGPILHGDTNRME